MGQAVDGRPVGDLTYNTRFGWLIRSRLSKKHGHPKARLPLKAELRRPKCKLRRERVRRANRRRRCRVRKAKGLRRVLPRVNAAKVGEARAEANAAITGVRMVGVKVAGRVDAIEGTTGVAIGRASMGPLKSTSRN
jgi:hypothetical protein